MAAEWWVSYRTGFILKISWSKFTAVKPVLCYESAYWWVSYKPVYRSADKKGQLSNQFCVKKSAERWVFHFVSWCQWLQGGWRNVLTVKWCYERLALEAGHTSSHDLINQEQVGGDHGAGVDHLPLDPVGVVDPLGRGHTGFTRVEVNSNLNHIWY